MAAELSIFFHGQLRGCFGWMKKLSFCQPFTWIYETSTVLIFETYALTLGST